MVLRASLRDVVRDRTFPWAEAHGYFHRRRYATRTRPPWHCAYGFSLAGRRRSPDLQTYRVGGVADHVHIAARLARTITQAQLLEKIKKTSSVWIKNQGGAYTGFFWQNGYGNFSIGWSQLEELVQYIDHQEEHHRTHIFQEEFHSLY